MSVRLRLGAIGGVSACLLAQPAAAQDYPSKPIKLIIAFGAGGGTDIVGRIVGQAMQDRLGQPVTIENRPGAAGTIGNEIVARADKDGYTLSIMVAGHAVAAAMRKQLRYDPLNDFEPIGLMAAQTLVIAARPDFKASTVAELVKAAQAEPGKISYASAGFGAVQHMAAELFSQSAKVQMVHVPFRTSPDAIGAVLGGQVQIIFDTTAAVLGQVQSKELKALAVTGKARLGKMPSVPTAIESGFAGYDVATWYGLFGPKGIPRPVVEKLNRTLLDSIKDKSVAERMDKAGFEVQGSSPEEFGRFLASELKRWNDVRVAAGLEQTAN